MAEAGYITLFLAFMTATYTVVAGIFGLRRDHRRLLNSARGSVIIVCGLVSIAIAILLYALLTHNYQIEYVHSYTGSDLPLPYLISALWAGNAGSLLFWCWLLSLSAAIVALGKSKLVKELLSPTLAVLMFIEVFFLILVLFVKSPFNKLSLAPAEGVGMNPLLENPGMIFHPPTLLAGFAIFAIPFALAVAALITNRLGNGWIMAARKWLILAWLLLGIGNIIGAWWAYVELGWGGYWAWDPIENAGLMPWLMATALLHSIIMQVRRGIFKQWNMVLVILTFSLTIFGAFLTRSDILSSVHTFSQTAMGPVFLTFLAIVLLGSFALFFRRRKGMISEAIPDGVFERRNTFLLNNILLVGAAFVILFGTIFPLFSEALTGLKIEVGKSFFNQMAVPLLLSIVFLSGVCILIGWRRSQSGQLKRKLLWPAATTLVLGIVLLISGISEWYALAAFMILGFALSATLSEWLRDLLACRRKKTGSYLGNLGRFISAQRSRYGGHIVHLGIAIMAIGVTGSSFYDMERETTLKPGDSIEINNYSLTYEKLENRGGLNKMTITTELSVRKGGRTLGKLSPAVQFHRNFEQSVSEVAIRSNLTEDLYVVLAGWDEQHNAAFKIKVSPLVSWVWVGGGVFLFGGLIAFWPTRAEKEKSA